MIHKKSQTDPSILSRVYGGVVILQKIKCFLKKNWLFAVGFVIIAVVMIILILKSTFTSAINMVLPVYETISQKNAVSSYDNVTETKGTNIIYSEKGVLFQGESGEQAGPFLFVYKDDIYFSWDTVARYIGQNGKIGYIRKDGTILTDPLYIEAAEFQDGTAKVSETENSIYYINSDGQRITRDYVDGSDCFEMQGSFARVQTSDGKWAIINRKDEMVFSGANSIEELPEVTTIGSAVFNGHAILFSLEPWTDEEFSIIAEYNNFSEISYVYIGKYAYVWTNDGKMGVVNCKGDVVVPAVYQYIEYKSIGDDLSDDNIAFLAHTLEGTIDVIKLRDKAT